MTNTRIATTFERIAALLEEQGAEAFRIHAWRAAAHTIRDQPRELADLVREHGRAGIEALPAIGHRIAAAIIELVKTGRSSTLHRLVGDPLGLFTTVPGLGRTLGERIHRELGLESLAELEAAANDGRLARVSGIGARRVALVRDLLAARRAHAEASPRKLEPPVELLLHMDRKYRDAALAGTLRLLAPRRHNPTNEAWLPIMHADLDGWSFTLQFSNTAFAHRAQRTRDWVVAYFHDEHGADGQATIVTEHAGRLAGRRVVRGREAECLERSTASDRERLAG